MHLLAAQPGAIEDGGDAVDLGQSPGDIVLLSAADTELACFAQAQARLGDGAPTLRLANMMQLGHNLSVDRYAEHVIAGARLVIVRLLGGESYWPYGVERLSEVCTERGIPIAWLPGDDKPDAGLATRSTLAPDAAETLWRYCTQGGIDNAEDALRYAATLIGHEAAWRPAPGRCPRAGLYWPGEGVRALEDVMARWRAGRPRAAVVFYRALLQAGSLAPVDALVAALRQEGLDPLPIFVTSLRDAPAAELIGTLMRTTAPEIVLNATGFAVSRPGAQQETPFAEAGVPVLQAIFAGATERQWAEATRGLSPRDIAMNVALPEVDGRILTRAVAFKTEARFDEATQAPIVVSEANQGRCRFVARLAAAWVRLARTAPAERRIALVLANYPQPRRAYRQRRRPRHPGEHGANHGGPRRRRLPGGGPGRRRRADGQAPGGPHQCRRPPRPARPRPRCRPPIMRASSPPCRRLCRRPSPSAGAPRKPTPSSV